MVEREGCCHLSGGKQGYLYQVWNLVSFIFIPDDIPRIDEKFQPLEICSLFDITRGLATMQDGGKRQKTSWELLTGAELRMLVVSF